MSHGHQKLDSLQTQRIAAGHTVTTLAKKAAVSDFTIIRAENGDDVEPNVALRLADALVVSLVTLGKRDM